MAGKEENPVELQILGIGDSGSCFGWWTHLYWNSRYAAGVSKVEEHSGETFDMVIEWMEKGLIKNYSRHWKLPFSPFVMGIRVSSWAVMGTEEVAFCINLGMLLFRLDLEKRMRQKKWACQWVRNLKVKHRAQAVRGTKLSIWEPETRQNPPWDWKAAIE